MRKCITFISVVVALVILSACHQKPVKSVVTPVPSPVKQEISTLELMPLSESIHEGWAEIELAGRKWFVDTGRVLTRNELASLSLRRNDKGNILLHLKPDQQGQNKINHALYNNVNYILMVLNGHAVSLSKINNSRDIPFFVGDDNTTIKVAEKIVQKELNADSIEY
ncbi:hypothetical protein [Citrobacter portucalensis]|uniref:hypothetical protein n=1 Tax=Citrobacter portucalensis TaxID=1639133 RepID=UPI0039FD67E4